MLSPVWMSLVLLAASPDGASAAGAPQAVSPLRQAHELRQAVSRQLRREALSEGAEQAAAVRALVALHRKLGRDATLTRDERTRLRGVIRSRMIRVSRRLERQSTGAAGAAGGRAFDDHGPELVELIQTVIAPASWRINGGPGTIYYYHPLRVLVIRQSSQVHHQVGAAVNQLRQ